LPLLEPAGEPLREKVDRNGGASDWNTRVTHKSKGH
jgi:hypothetical protein